MRLYNVIIKAEIVVLAENEDAASDLAIRELDDNTIDQDSEIEPGNFESEARVMDSLPEGWNEKSIPFGDQDPDDPDRTVLKLGTAASSQEHVDARAIHERYA